jgi:hypothetical protein
MMSETERMREINIYMEMLKDGDPS